MSNLELTLVIILGVAVVSLLIYLIIKGIKNKWFSQLNDTIKKAIKEAEESGKSGDEKKLYVLKAIEKKCEELGIPYKLLAGLISKLIDEIVSHYNIIKK